MATTWDFDTVATASRNGKLDFTTFAPGVTTIRVVDDAPHLRWIHWQQKHKRSLNCPGRGCPICEIRRQQKLAHQSVTQPMARRLAIHVINRDAGRLEICEMGPAWFQQLRDLLDELALNGKSLSQVDVKIRRRGTGKDDTSYRLDIGEAYPLTSEDLELMTHRIDLDKFFEAHTPEQIQRILNGEDWVAVMTDK